MPLNPNDESPLRRTLRSSERRQAAQRPPMTGIPSEVELIGLMTQSKLDRRMVMLPCMYSNQPTLVVCVDHIPATDSFAWSLFSAATDELEIVWSAMNPSPYSVMHRIADMRAKVPTGETKVSAPQLGEFLMNNGIISHAALLAALNLQKSARMGAHRIGEILAMSGEINAQLVKAAVMLQGLIKCGTININYAGDLLKKAKVQGWGEAEIIQQVRGAT
jgi:hypothetical protein